MVKDFLVLLTDGKVPAGPEILAASGPGLLKQVEQTSRLEWIPAAPIVKLADEARTIVGAEKWRSLHRGAASDLMQRPLFRALTQGMRTVFGATPAAYCKIFPIVLNQAHRNYGPIEHVSIDGTTSKVRFTQCPPDALSLGMLDVFAGTLEGLAARTARGVRVDVEYKPGADSAALVVRWEA